MIRVFVFWLFVSMAANLIAGLVGFAMAAEKIAATAQLTKADAIVVLTGGSGERLRYAGELYQQGAAQRLLVSGVNPQVSEQDLLELLGLSKADLHCCVDLDIKSRNTLENANQISVWAKSNSYYRLLVVTTTYHMPRTKFLLRSALPNAQLVFAPARNTGAAKQHTYRRTFVEYGKFLVVLFFKPLSKKQIT